MEYLVITVVSLTFAISIMSPVMIKRASRKPCNGEHKHLAFMDEKLEQMEDKLK